MKLGNRVFQRGVTFVQALLLAVGPILAFSSCPAQIITIMFTGDFSRFVTGTAQISIGGGPMLNHEIDLTADGAIIQLSASNGERIAFVVMVETLETTQAGGQRIKERQAAQGSFSIPGAHVEINGVDEDGPLEWIGRIDVSNDGVTATFPYDPCDLFASLTVTDGGEACEVTTECTLYDEPDGEGNALATISDADGTQCSYPGGNIFTDMPGGDPDGFIDTCKLDAWESAEAMTCYKRNDVVHCLIIAWNNPNNAP